MFIRIPSAIKFVTKLDPPYEIKGSGTPVRGTKATMELRFTNI